MYLAKQSFKHERGISNWVKTKRIYHQNTYAKKHPKENVLWNPLENDFRFKKECWTNKLEMYWNSEQFLHDSSSSNNNVICLFKNIIPKLSGSDIM